MTNIEATVEIIKAALSTPNVNQIPIVTITDDAARAKLLKAITEIHQKFYELNPGGSAGAMLPSRG